MPCRSDYMEANPREVESRLVCQLLRYLLTALNRKVPARIAKGADAYYGDVDHLDEDTATLCELCAALSPTEQASILYDGRKKDARRLADWWEAHQAADRRRVKNEQRSKEQAKLRKQALAKLTPAERAALDL